MQLFRLIYNEFIKQFKKASTKSIFALILVLAIAIPMIFSNIKSTESRMYNEESMKFIIGDLENYISELENKTSQKDKMDKKYTEVQKEYNEIFLNNKISYDEWKAVEANEYQTKSYKLANIQFVLEGYNKETVLQHLRGQDLEGVSKYYELSKSKQKEIEAQFIKEREDLLNVIESNDYKRHIALEIERKQGWISSNQAIIDEYKKLEATNPTSEEKKAKLKELKKEADIAAERNIELEQDLVLTKFRYDKDINYDTGNWKNNAILEIEKTLADYRTKMLDEKQFSVDLHQSLTTSYEDYVENFKKANISREEKMKELWYSLENNIPDLGSVKDARSVIDFSYEIFIVLAVIMAIIIGGPIVANEFSTGSIRLLLIRPVARWKVLLAKLSLVLLVGYSVVILGTTILSVSSGFVFGFDTLNVPVLQTINGQIVEVNYFKYMIPSLITSTASLIFIASIVFMLSTVARNTALAVAVGMLLYIGTPFASQLLINAKQTWILSTLIPYINSSYFKLMPGVAEELVNAGLQLNYVGGAIQLLVVSAVILVITFAVFMKRDVKN